MSILNSMLEIFVGSRNERQVRGLEKEVARINALEPEFQRLSDAQLRAKTTEFKHRIESGESIDSLLYEAFAAVREAAKRTLGQRHFDVQLEGGMVLHRGSIAEMVTGEGKTLTATAPVYLNALSGRGVHVITVNDYLARRDAEWMGNVYRMLGLSVGFIQSDMDNRERRQMYGCDVTYGTNNEFGFDYLRDNMKQDARDQVQRGLNYTIIDEVDSILIDEARTPLIISGPTQDYSELYDRADAVARKLEGIHDKDLKAKLGKDAGVREVYLQALEDYDFEIREKESQCLLTDRGIERVERFLGIGHLYDASNQGWPHMIEQALRAHHLFKRDKNYVVHEAENGSEIVIVDEFTGRLQHGRRWSDGLHQAVEAKEKIKVREESQTYATVTLQNYFKLYQKIAGMTGSAMTEAAEFDTIYQLDVTAIPTNRPLVRHDRDDLIYGSEGDKFQAAVAEVTLNHLVGRPVLLGTTSVVKSERLSTLLDRTSIRYADGKLSVHTPAFKLPAPGSGKRGGADIEEVKVEARIMELDNVREHEGSIQIRMADPSVRVLNPKNDPNTETWFPVRGASGEKLKDPAGFVGIPHHVLNAKLHAKEAEIVAQAGGLGAITIATNMAGRGTDIILGGNGEYFTKQWLKREKGIDLKALLPEEYRDTPSFGVPRDVQIAAEKAYDAEVRKAFAENFKKEFDAAHEEVVKLGGLAVIGTERHESRRIDNQLRGRCGRQGDPGSSQFFISLDDDLMRLFAGPRVRSMMRGLGLKDGEAIQARMITRSVERAQRKVEGHHFDVRKNLKEYDDVLDLQRKTIYRLRQTVLEGVAPGQAVEIDARVRGLLNELLGMEEGVSPEAARQVCDWMRREYGVTWAIERVSGQRRLLVRDEMILAAKLSHLPQGIAKALEDRVFNVVHRLLLEHAPRAGAPALVSGVQAEALEAFRSQAKHVFDAELPPDELVGIFTPSAAATVPDREPIADGLAKRLFEAKRKEVVTTPDGAENPERLTQLGRYFLLRSLDTRWIDHLRNMEQLRYGVHWEAQAQKDPKVAYKKEGLALFEQLLDDIDTEVVRSVFHVKVQLEPPRIEQERALLSRSKDIGAKAMEAAKAASASRGSDAARTAAPRAGTVRVAQKLPGPNDPCWCDSGKKYKKCHQSADRANAR